MAASSTFVIHMPSAAFGSTGSVSDRCIRGKALNRLAARGKQNVASIAAVPAARVRIDLDAAPSTVPEWAPDRVKSGREPAVMFGRGGPP